MLRFRHRCKHLDLLVVVSTGLFGVVMTEFCAASCANLNVKGVQVNGHVRFEVAGCRELGCKVQLLIAGCPQIRDFGV